MNQLGTKLQTFARDFLLNQVYRRKKSSFVPDLIFLFIWTTLQFISFLLLESFPMYMKAEYIQLKDISFD